MPRMALVKKPDDVDLQVRDLRTRQLYFRVSEEELHAVQEECRRIGLNPSDFLREAVREKILARGRKKR